MIFNKYFEVFICDTKESIAIHHNIRYQVYCEELGYEDKEKFPDKQEIDEYDTHSAKFIIRYKETKEYIGAFRCLHSKVTTLPVEKLCELFEPVEDNAREMSRVCILKHFRTRNICIGDDKNIQTTILRAIVEAGGEYCFHRLTLVCYWMVRPALAKLLTSLGLNMTLAGNQCEHRGKRYPYKSTILDMMGYYHGQFLKCEAYRYYSHLSPEEL